MKKYLFGSLIVLALVALIAVCARKDSAKVLVMGTNAEFPPFETRGGEDGSAIVGFDVEVARAIAAKVGRPLKIAEMPFDSLLPALSAGQVDMVLRGLAITPERARSVDFSLPYYQATQVVLIRKGDPVPASKDDLKGRRIGVQLGTTGAGAAAELSSPENVRQASSPLRAVVDLMNSQVDIVIMDEQPAIRFEKKNPELLLVRLAFDAEVYGVAVKKGNAELLAKVNEALAEIAADGRCEQYVDQWMVQMVDTADAEGEATE